LEVSDDSDIEVHPNVDKRSFIRAKQAQIHQERERRKHQIATLKYERQINDGMLLRIDRLSTALKSHKASDRNPDELIFQSLIESATEEDKPPEPPEGVYKNVEDQPTFSKMMASLVDQVKKEVDGNNSDNRYDAYILEIGKHRTQIEDLQNQLVKKLDELEKEAKRHITSDDIHTGFDYSNVAATKAESTSSASKKETTVELLNPSSATSAEPDSGAEADIEQGVNNDDEMEASPLAKKFATIPVGDYKACIEFLSTYPQVLKEKETDGLLVEAFNSELEGKHKHAKACVHYALLLQYCRQLGKDGVALFFKRITTKDHQAQKMFNDDVRDTYTRIHTRVSEIKKEREQNAEAGGVEEIQLHAVDPDTTIHIQVPEPVTAESEPELRAAREIFESFPPGLQRALDSGKLEEINKVLAKMSVEEAEEVVEKLSDGGMLRVEKGVIDATTEEGKKQVEEIERTRQFPVEMEGVVDESTLAGDPE
jgi:cell division cycle protein 37